MKKFLSITAVLLLLVIISIPVKLFFIGEPLDAALVHCTVTEDDDELHLNVSTPASAIAFRGWKFRQEGTTLYISARKVLVSRFYFSGVYGTSIPRGDLTEIYFGGNLIWSANNTTK